MAKDQRHITNHSINGKWCCTNRSISSKNKSQHPIISEAGQDKSWAVRLKC